MGRFTEMTVPPSVVIINLQGRFERREAQYDTAFIGYAMYSGTPQSTQADEKPKNYGADLSTLARMIERGEI